MNSSKNYFQLACMWCEQYGVVEYKLKHNILTYNVSYPASLSNPHCTVKHIVNLDTMQETTEMLKRFDKRGLVNRH